MLLQKHYDKLKFVINHGSDEQLRDIGLDQKTISRLRQDISYIREVKLSTALKLYHFYFDYWATIVGIDIGTSEFLSASDLSMKKIYTDQSKEVSRIINKYENRLKDSNMDAGKIERKFLKGLKKHINSVIKELLELYPYPRIFIIGKGSSINEQDSIYGKVFAMTHKCLYKAIEDYDEIVLIDEQFTSLICPRCNHTNKKNRTKNNRFHCQSCGYEHPNDNVVASYNIAQRFWKNNVTGKK